MTNTPPTPQEIVSISESDIDFSSSGFKRYRFIDKTYKAYVRAKPKASEKEVFNWVRSMIRKLDMGVAEKDLPPITRPHNNPELEEIARAMEDGKQLRIKEAMDILRPYISYIRYCNPARGKELEALFIANSLDVGKHPATLLLEWMDTLNKEQKYYAGVIEEYRNNLEVAE
jgi:hypothetical protein